VLHVLLVDDDENTRFLVRRALARLRLQVSEAASAEEALEFLETNRVDAILSDYRMPGKNGVELLCIAKESQPRARRVLMSGTLQEDHLRTRVKDGCADFLFEKPMERDAWEPILTVALRLDESAPAG
jgi:DNA-binding NtrC family response regulator